MLIPVLVITNGFFLTFYFMFYMYGVLPACMSGVLGGQERALNLLGLELLMARNCHMGAENQT